MGCEAHVGIGSNLGDRQANIVSALQRLRARCDVVRVSSMYESPPAGGAGGPAYLNLAAQLRFAGEPAALAPMLHDVELSVGRAAGTKRLAPRPIDIDLLAVDGALVRNDLAGRPYNAIPLVEIAPHLIAAPSGGRVRKLERSLHPSADRQNARPQVELSLERAGVSGVRRIVRLDVDGRERLYACELSMVADLASDRAGVHMSRFAELLEAATLDVLADERTPMRAERLAEAIAREIVASQRADRAEVRLRAEFSLERWTPVSAKRGEETYTLLGIASADRRGTRLAVGVEAEGMTACPCAQDMVREHALRELLAAGFAEADARRALDVLPGATHNQRGRGTVLLGIPGEVAVRAEDLVEIVESSMSSETYDLLKRPDEFFVVNKAHFNPRFVEDVVRGILARTLDMYADFADTTFVFASHVNEESIHKHDAFAQGYGTFGQLRAGLRGERSGPRTDMEAWLQARD